MNKKALTAAIAASLAAPMAAQAVDFSISGHVNRGLFITDTDDGSDITIENNTSSSTRIRATGSGKLDTGHTAGIQLEYQESGTTLGLRHANVHFSGDFGKLTLGQGSEAADGAVYSDKTGVFGIGQGQDMAGSSLGDYFPSLDGGTRTDMIRYDTPALGPVGIAISAGNGDRYSAKAVFTTEMMDSDIKVQLGYGKVNTDAATKEVDQRYVVQRHVFYSGSSTPAAPDVNVNPTLNREVVTPWADASAVEQGYATAGLQTNNNAGGSGTAGSTDTVWSDEMRPVEHTVPSGATETLNVSFGMKHASGLTWSASWASMESDVNDPTTMQKDEDDIKPTYFQTTVGYVFGNNAIGLSWYDGKETGGNSEAEVTAIGVGFIHKMPKAGVELYAAAQNYDVSDEWRLGMNQSAPDVDETVMVVGARVKF